jgi:hypothetical protein
VTLLGPEGTESAVAEVLVRHGQDQGLLVDT